MSNDTRGAGVGHSFWVRPRLDDRCFDFRGAVERVVRELECGPGVLTGQDRWILETLSKGLEKSDDS